MAIASTVTVTSQSGAREDLSNQLRRVAPHQCPMYSTLPQSAAPKALFTEWLVDDLENPNYVPRPDGKDLVHNTDYEDSISSRVRIGNRIQSFDRSSTVSPIAELIDVAGPETSLLAASKAKQLMTLKTDVEAAIGSGQVPAAGTTTVGDKLGGFFHLSNPSATNGVFDSSAKQAFRSIGGTAAQNGTAVNSRFDFTSNTLTEAKFRKLLQSVYEAGGKSQTYRLFAGSELMNAVTDFSRALNVVGDASRAQFNANISGTTMTLSVVELVTDFGIVQVIPSLFLNRTSGSALGAAGRKAGALIPTDDTVNLKVLQPVTMEDLPNSLGGERFNARTILTLCVTNPRAIGSIV